MCLGDYISSPFTAHWLSNLKGCNSAQIWAVCSSGSSLFALLTFWSSHLTSTVLEKCMLCGYTPANCLHIMSFYQFIFNKHLCLVKSFAVCFAHISVHFFSSFSSFLVLVRVPDSETVEIGCTESFYETDDYLLIVELLFLPINWAMWWLRKEKPWYWCVTATMKEVRLTDPLIQ